MMNKKKMGKEEEDDENDDTHKATNKEEKRARFVTTHYVFVSKPVFSSQKTNVVLFLSHH